jgi:hypothetical protein
MDPVVPITAPDTVAPQVQQTSAPASMEIEIVDTPAAAPEPQAAPPALIFGKYRTIEDAEKAYAEAQRAMHEKSQEAATYRKVLDERQAAPVTPHPAPPPVDFDGQFRERLAENPAATIFEMTKYAAKQMIDEQQRTQRELVRKYQSFASRPEYASVAQEVAAQLPFAQENPIDPVEGSFLRARIAQLEAQVSGGLNRPVSVPYVEPGGMARRAGTGTMRVELEPDTSRMHIGQDKMRELAKIVAKQKSSGGDMRGMSIDDWEKANA